ncbi:MAG TPA: polysaccharide deacetylase family protein [Polyangia bacterium]
MTMPLHALLRALAGAAVLLIAAFVLGRWSPALGAVPVVLGLALVWLLVPQVLPGATFARGRGDGDAMALTFDDGPNGDHTRAVLDVLRREGVRATFFLVGEAAAREPDLVRAIAADGHAIGNHTMNHRILSFLSRPALERELDAAQRAITGAGVPRPTLFRAPHGFRRPFLGGALARLGLTPCAWSHGVWDTDRPGSAVIAARARRAVRPGSVLLLHDGGAGADRSQTAAALPAIIAAARARRLRLVTLPELIAEAHA